MCLLIAWCNNPRELRRPIFSNKTCISQNMRLIVPNISDVELLAEGRFHALDTNYWKMLLESQRYLNCEIPQYPPNTPEDHDISENNLPLAQILHLRLILQNHLRTKQILRTYHEVITVVPHHPLLLHRWCNLHLGGRI